MGEGPETEAEHGNSINGESTTRRRLLIRGCVGLGLLGGTIVVAIVTIITVLYLGRFPFESQAQFRAAPESDRIAVVSDALDAAKLPTNERFLLMYIDRMLTQADQYKVLEAGIQSPAFADFFPQAVVAVYCAYEPENFKVAPPETQELARRLILSWFPYQLSYGEEAFLAELNNYIDQGDDFVFFYHLEDGKHPDDFWHPELREVRTWALSAFAWNELTFSDFERLPRGEQAQLLRWNAWIKLNTNGTLNDDTLQALDFLEEEWRLRADRYLARRSMKALEATTPYPVVYKTVLDEAFK
jgi:hypothetical protein